jgi:hypothetical protein
MSDEIKNVNVNSTEGYYVTSEAINRIDNPFLEIEGALGQNFYFFAGEYDQIVLEQIYAILFANDGSAMATDYNDIVRRVNAYLDESDKRSTKDSAGIGDFQYLLSFLESNLSDANKEYAKFGSVANIGDMITLFNGYSSASDGTPKSGTKSFLEEVDSFATLLKPNTSNESDYYTSLQAVATGLQALVTGLENESGLILSDINAAIQLCGDDPNLAATKRYLQEAKVYADALDTEKGNITVAQTQLNELANKPIYEQESVLSGLAAAQYNFSAALTNLQNKLESALSSMNGLPGESAAIVDGELKTSVENAKARVQGLTSSLNTLVSDCTIASGNLNTVKSLGLVDARRAFDNAVTAYRNAIANGNGASLDAAQKFSTVISSAEGLADKIASTKSGEDQTKFRTDVDDTTDKFDGYTKFYDYIGSIISFCNGNKALLVEKNTAIAQYYDGSSNNLKTNLSIANYKDIADLLGTMFAAVKGKKNKAQNALDAGKADLNKVIGNLSATTRTYDDLLSLCMLGSTPRPNSSGKYDLVTSIKKISSATGTSYEIVTGGSISKADYEKSFSKEDACAGMALPYFALAIMYEKTCIQNMMLTAQLEAIEEINEEISKNNEMLKALSWLYDKVYAGASAEYGSFSNTEVNGFKEDIEKNELIEVTEYCRGVTNSAFLEYTGLSISDIDVYLKQNVGIGGGFANDTTRSKVLDYTDDYGIATVTASDGNTDLNEQQAFYFATAHFDSEGKRMKSGGWKNKKSTTNIDVDEQAALTFVSSLQDQVRIYGDKLSTDAQMMTTRMQQYMQDANACVSACTQTVKSVGDYFKSTISNVR